MDTKVLTPRLPTELIPSSADQSSQGKMGPRLRHLGLTGGSSECELPERVSSFLWQLRGLTRLDLESCLGGCLWVQEGRLLKCTLG